MNCSFDLIKGFSELVSYDNVCVAPLLYVHVHHIHYVGFNHSVVCFHNNTGSEIIMYCWLFLGNTQGAFLLG